MFLEDITGRSSWVDTIEQLIELLSPTETPRIMRRFLTLIESSRLRGKVLDWALENPDQVPEDLEIEFLSPTPEELAALHQIKLNKHMPYSYGRLML